MCIWTLVQSGIVNISKSLSKQETIKINLVTLILLNCNLFSHIEKKKRNPLQCLLRSSGGHHFNVRFNVNIITGLPICDNFFFNSFKIIFQYNVLDTVI